MTFAKEPAQFSTITCLNWIDVLKNEREKDIVIQSLSFLTKERRVMIFSFVIMSNHLHLVWQVQGDFMLKDVQRDFLKYTSQQILKNFRNENSSMLRELLVNSKDRKYQIWERDSLHIPLWSSAVFDQKIEYVHQNPVKAALVEFPSDYKYSSAGFYEQKGYQWEFLTHVDG